ncbi:ribose 5-phosphate isomerase B [Bacteroidales bacterium OttesenSCG-928-K03]|nr:ribose 5-phosphate isomerase B [Bacteroidales bacterium OttesenSCG-928-L14]MDL2241139.1 ribose 5-phosphate isomerase B [Bacteroidales bacterium OttesenSCG-928-K22]MDL2242297.1 ribose 5-phosphate isomerase B [Bacteroidales bacterium OttesenSCG-928-K03]
MKKHIGIACDHAGFSLKEKIKDLLKNDYEVIDFGTNSEESVDYPDYIHPLASKINKGELTRGIIICGSGNGVAMTANKYPNVRAAICWKEEIAVLARQHNDANILSLPARFISDEEANKIVRAFLNTNFEGGRHQGRVDKINKIIL